MERNTSSTTYRRRISALLWTVLLIWTALAARLFYWQIVCHEDLSVAAASQYQMVTEGLDTRGAILDRNGQPLTGGVEQFYYFLKTEAVDSQAEKLLDAVSAQRVSEAQNGTAVYSVYRTSMFDETVSQSLREDYGAYVFSGTSRYQDSQTACHLIGYLNQSEKRGVSGLEQLYEQVLQADSRSLALWADGGGSLLLHIPPRQKGAKSMQQNRLTTTIDRELQIFCEAAISSRGLDGAVLVSEAESGQVLAWVSAPSFNPNRLEEYLEEGNSSLVNKCIQGLYAPGSVFKIVVAAAALEQETVSPYAVYECTGETEVNSVVLGCQAGPEEGHGTINMYEAMAVSCNCYFAQLGNLVGVEEILDTARRLGFGERVFDSFLEEEDGSLPKAEECGPWDVSNLSIGQGTILATPAQVQQMMAAVACGGVLHPLNVVFEEEHSESGSGAKRVLSSSAADQLYRMLQMVMTEGTGSGLEWNCMTAGKTGTAEAVSGGQLVSNCWFSGFCRMENNRMENNRMENGQPGEEIYVVTVLVERGISGSASALPIFQEICGYLAERRIAVQ